MIFAGNRALLRDHNDALRKYGDLARVVSVWNNVNGFCVEFSNPFGWCDEMSDDSSLYTHIQKFLKDRNIEIEIHFVNPETRTHVAYYILSISSVYGKVSCKTIWEVQQQLRRWEISQPRIDELLVDAVARVRRDGEFTDDRFKRYLWAEEHHRMFRHLIDGGADPEWAANEAGASVQEYKDIGDDPPYYVEAEIHYDNI